MRLFPAVVKQAHAISVLAPSKEQRSLVGKNAISTALLFTNSMNVNMHNRLIRSKEYTHKILMLMYGVYVNETRFQGQTQPKSTRH